MSASLSSPSCSHFESRRRTKPRCTVSSSKTAPTNWSPSTRSKETASATTAQSAKNGKNSPTRSSTGPPPTNTRTNAPPPPPPPKPSSSTRNLSTNPKKQKPPSRSSPEAVQLDKELEHESEKAE